ncbi:hypothetical protein BBP14_11230 [Limosilactobacillus reuteri]|nr:hypothetical protein BBP14_11230 [Limosilactobacillus reuteri]
MCDRIHSVFMKQEEVVKKKIMINFDGNRSLRIKLKKKEKKKKFCGSRETPLFFWGFLGGVVWCFILFFFPK